MLFWEGSTFIILLFFLSTSLLILYLRNQRKTKALQDFFLSLTHELKTPLASIKLQGEVIGEMVSKYQDVNLDKLISRLGDDTIKLEIQMDKILQLSRLERGGSLNVTNLSLVPFIKNEAKKWKSSLTIDISSNIDHVEIEADEFALELILKNLFENSKNHGTTKKVSIEISSVGHFVNVIYSDGSIFTGDEKKLTELFYKHNSKKGSGIGLYLVKKLSSKMGAFFKVSFTPSLTFHFTFKMVENSHA
jgi:signal transduction histidine kinase